MKITSPIFLQQAGRAGKTPFAGIKVLFPYANPIIGSVSGNGDITVTSVKNGEKISNTYSNPEGLTVSVQADANTWVIITGEITSFECNAYYISKLTAINNTELTMLNCSGCVGLTTLDLSNNNALTGLDCSECTILTTLDLRNSAALESLSCYSCVNLTALDLSNNTALTTLALSNLLGLTALDLSNNTALESLTCYDCAGLTALDLSNNTALEGLDCTDCVGLTTLDLSNNNALERLDCNGCTRLTTLDLSNNTALTFLGCGNCTALDSIKYGAENEDIATDIAELITANEALDGTVYTNSAGAHYSTIADAATAAGWTIAQL